MLLLGAALGLFGSMILPMVQGIHLRADRGLAASKTMKPDTA